MRSPSNDCQLGDQALQGGGFGYLMTASRRDITGIKGAGARNAKCPAMYWAVSHNKERPTQNSNWCLH